MSDSIEELIKMAAIRDGLKEFVPNGIETAIEATVEEVNDLPQPSHYAAMLEPDDIETRVVGPPSRVEQIIERKVQAYREKLYAELEQYLDDEVPKPGSYSTAWVRTTFDRTQGVAIDTAKLFNQDDEGDSDESGE